jgi:hypothetical protein
MSTALGGIAAIAPIAPVDAAFTGAKRVIQIGAIASGALTHNPVLVAGGVKAIVHDELIEEAERIIERDIERALFDSGPARDQAVPTRDPGVLRSPGRPETGARPPGATPPSTAQPPATSSPPHRKNPGRDRPRKDLVVRMTKVRLPCMCACQHLQAGANPDVAGLILALR